MRQLVRRVTPLMIVLGALWAIGPALGGAAIRATDPAGDGHRLGVWTTT